MSGTGQVAENIRWAALRQKVPGRHQTKVYGVDVSRVFFYIALFCNWLIVVQTIGRNFVSMEFR